MASRRTGPRPEQALRQKVADLGRGHARCTQSVSGPHNVLGIGLNEYAAELARVTVWIGGLQWRIQRGYGFKTHPVLEPLDHIECRDAVLGADGREAVWPVADAVVGNPPFVGDKKMRGELGDPYTEALRAAYKGRVPGGADLVCYWFEKARGQIEAGALQRAGLVSTNSIRGGKNREVMDAVVKSARIFEAWSDQAWVNNGAAVRVSLVAFGAGESSVSLNGAEVAAVSADLTAGGAMGVNLTVAKRLIESQGACFEGIKKYGQFDVPGQIAREWLRLGGNPHGKPNSDVLHPWINATDVVRRDSDTWIIDFTSLSKEDAELCEQPFRHAETHVMPELAKDRNARTRERWWLFERARQEMRDANAGLGRFSVTPIVAKHRTFAWRSSPTLAMNLLDVIARADDTTFGILHSRFHELWSLRMCTWMGVGNDPRYTPTTCFETVPLPRRPDPCRHRAPAHRSA